MGKFNRFLFIVVCLFFAACNSNNQAGKAGEPGEESLPATFNFDSILHCYDYSYLDHYFFTADYGCIYDPNGKNRFGNLSVYLIPYKSIDSTKGDSIAQKISGMDIATIKRTFKPYVFLIPPEHLNYNSSADPVYYQKENYTEKLYSFDSTNNRWNLVDSFAAQGNKSEKEQSWREQRVHSALK